MNIALSAVLISILLIPPVVFYLFLYIGKYQRTIPKFSLFEGILGAAIVSLFIHAIALYFNPCEIRFDILIKLLGGEVKEIEKKITNTEFRQALIDFSFYNFYVLLAMIVLGRISRIILLKTGLHARVSYFSLYNKWWYLFNGYNNDIAEVDLIFIDAVVDTKDGTMIYSGFLSNFDFNDGELERIYLSDTIRREFKKYDDHNKQLINETSEPVQIPGDIFSLPYKNIINLNIHFLALESNLEEIKQLPDENL